MADGFAICLYSVPVGDPQIAGTPENLHLWALMSPDLPIQPDIVEVHLTCATGRRAALRAETNGNGIDIGKIYTRKCLVRSTPANACRSITHWFHPPFCVAASSL